MPLEMGAVSGRPTSASGASSSRTRLRGASTSPRLKVQMARREPGRVLLSTDADEADDRRWCPLPDRRPILSTRVRTRARAPGRARLRVRGPARARA